MQILLNLKLLKDGKLSAKSKSVLTGILKRKKSSGYRVLKAQSTIVKPVTFLIPLSHSHADRALEIYRAKHGNRKKNVDNPVASYKTGHHVKDIVYKGSFKGWRGESHTPTLKSYGRIGNDGKLLAYIAEDKPGFIKAGLGYTWQLDNANNPMLVKTKTGDEYHVDMLDIQTGFEWCRKQLLILAEARKAQNYKKSGGLKNYSAFFRKNPVEITFKDSVSAGNCSAGTTEFARVLMLDVKKAYNVVDVIKKVLVAPNLTAFQLDRFERVLFLLQKRASK